VHAFACEQRDSASRVAKQRDVIDGNDNSSSGRTAEGCVVNNNHKDNDDKFADNDNCRNARTKGAHLAADRCTFHQ